MNVTIPGLFRRVEHLPEGPPPEVHVVVVQVLEVDARSRLPRRG